MAGRKGYAVVRCSCGADRARWEHWNRQQGKKKKEEDRQVGIFAAMLKKMEART
ncbi:hypothetical protein Ga0466249_005286 [Sporomusaceae bacterium BoRhaA]|uniref:hypothetical protein n=1 Tax=Pelorhabdus rhamnosifermentans TaxID=2772457 RepID=UPI001C062A20|nr:hypothetical protein [Pelorhabdus rhamnosifermentans]MBU2704132.1 hypothetical protein [Pelorhabdus rhamnosifermentans]